MNFLNYCRKINNTSNQNYGSIFLCNGEHGNKLHICDILEPFPSKIPDGTYTLIMHKWSKSGQLVPMFLNVPGHSYILIHTGNYVSESLGCLLTGTLVQNNSKVENSRYNFGVLMTTINKYVSRPLTIVVKSEFV